ncbi:MAG TPA: hypothetical protein VFL95_01140, partial [Gemmatimonadales bacterium]|nr:hypothetical protein [Gemmatimonadales bacterium]
PARARRDWVPWAVSLLVHTTLILLAVFYMRQPDSTPSPRPVRVSEPEVAMVYMPEPEPKPAPPALTRPRPQTPPPQSQQQPRPLPPPTPKMERQPEHDEPAPMTPDPAPAQADAPTTPPRSAASPSQDVAAAPLAKQPTEVATMESEARRIFGRHPANQGTAGPLAIPGLPVYMPESAERCTPKPATPGPVQLDTVTGLVYEPETGAPLPGAFLQIMGTQYAAFANDLGQYRLVFDRSLVDQCRTQWVRVTATGRRSQTLILSRGPGSTDIPLKRR